MNNKLRFMCIGLLSALIPFVGRSEQKPELGSRFQVLVDYHYFFGLSQKVGKYATWRRSDMNMYGHSLRLTGMYAFTPRLAAGAGIGTDNYVNGGFHTVPVFAAFRYAPFRAALSPYVFTDIGYAIDTSVSDNGVLWELGVGYKRMFRKHFGMKFEAGYSLQQIRLTEKNFILIPDGDGNYPSVSPFSMFRHSLLLGIGLVF